MALRKPKSIFKESVPQFSRDQEQKREGEEVSLPFLPSRPSGPNTIVDTLQSPNFAQGRSGWIIRTKHEDVQNSLELQRRTNECSRSK